MYYIKQKFKSYKRNFPIIARSNKFFELITFINLKAAKGFPFVVIVSYQLLRFFYRFYGQRETNKDLWMHELNSLSLDTIGIGKLLALSLKLFY